MARIRRRDALAIALIALLSGLLFASPAVDPLRGLTIDALTALRWHVYGPRLDPAEAPTVVVAIDEETYQAPPFKGSPTITWTREIGHVLNALVDADVAAVGFDVVFPTSIEQSEMPFGDAVVGARMRGFDRDFLRSLHAAAKLDKIVLGEMQLRDQPIRPSAGQRFAVGQQRNIRALNAYTDPDGVVRRLPTSFATEGQPVPSMAVELAARALGSEPQFLPDGSLSLAGHRFPAAIPETITLNFDGGSRDILTYSLADLRACAEKGDQEFFRRHFEGKVVVLGTLLDIEDRKATSKRFTTGLERAWAPRCALPMQTATGQIRRDTMSGVYIHATGINNLIRQDALRELPPALVALIAIAIAAAAAVAARLLAPAAAALALLVLLGIYLGGAVVVFQHTLVLPLVEPFLAGLAALAATVGYRFVIADKEERLLRRSFAMYLAPQVIDKMVESDSPPTLGGEIRDVTVLFTDIAGFSSIAEKITPQALVALMNDYLSAMTDIIEAAGGYVDKYVGDSIVAVFGAPLDDADHARHAVGAALACRDRLLEMNNSDEFFQGHRLGHRIGINSGEALLGNIGSRRRFNYTMMGDAVNLASRLEGANRYFGTSILVSEATVTLTGDHFAWREIDAIRVKGIVHPVRVYHPLAETGQESAAQRADSAVYAQGLAAWRAADFAAAAACFERIADHDEAAALFAQRAREMAAQPPPADWEPVYTLEGK
ncbi:CHASE2 domain-containing protein [Piscinibacter sakaiensis]|uniref:CHASE2 domain-containing protein n=1 Tax=Piscinibacter sakaiensis TaxID=1547922 RepID=UPI003AAF6B03